MVEKFYKLTTPQKSIWNMEKFFEGTTINNICASITILNNLDENALKQSIYNIVKKNDSFRIKIVVKEHIPVQYFSEFEPFEIEVINLSSKDDLEKIKENLMNYKYNIIDSNLFCFKIVKFQDGHGMLIFTVHHIIADSWSLGLFAQNIMHEYTLLTNNELQNQEINHSYIEYIDSESAYLQSKKYETDKLYWQEMFKNIPEPVTFIGTKNNSKIKNYHSKRSSFKINFDIAKKINEYCNTKKISVFQFLMAIYSIYLSKTTGLSEFVIGTPILNRTNFKEKNTMGMFVNTIPVKISIPQSETFSNFTHSLSLNILNNLKHQKYSYSQLLEDLRNENSTNGTLYQVILSYQITKAFNELCGNYTTDWYGTNHSMVDCTIQITDINNTGELVIHYDYLDEKYTENDIESLHFRINNIIDQVLCNNDININAIDIVTKEEKNKILCKFNNTKTIYPKNKNIIDLFDEQVKKTPNNIAVVFENQKLTYQELEEKANYLAYYLKSNGVKNNDVVSIFLDKSLESIISILAILKCNSIYMPIDIDYPSERIKYMLQNSNSKLILTSKKLRNKLENFSKIICIDLDNKEIYNNIIISNQKSTLSSEDLAYIMYTSGSTGEPKGVMVTHKNIIRLVKNNRFITFQNHENILQTGSLVFDACTFEIWASLLNGFSLYIIKKQDLLDPKSLENYLEKNKITILWITAPLFNQISESNPKMFQNIRVLLTGGDILSPKHINAVRNTCPNLKIINGYGPTENTTFSTCFTINKTYKSNIPIGYPISNSTCYIVSKDLSLMPIGIYGELLVGGDGVSKGYINKPDYTKEKFIKNIFGDGILYKTGDLAKWNDDGSIEFAGRIDNQVKIRGFRVELEEITLTIQKFTGIKECITIVKSIHGENIICSYFSANKSIDINELKDFLKKSIPNYAIPTYFMQLDILPINTNGKIDRKKLPEPKYINTKKDIILPRNDIDKKLINILQNILKIDKISITDSFFELGGDSLSAITLSLRLQEKFNIKISVKEIIENPSIEHISDTISKNVKNSNITKIEPIEQAEYYKVSFAQKRIYSSSLLAGENSIVYNIPGGIIFNKPINLEKLKKSIQELINRHESLRTYFEICDNEIVQKIEKNFNFKLEILENKNFDDLESIFKDFVKPFNLTKAPLFRAKVVKFKNKKTALLFDVHHIVFDGLSMQILIDELNQLYNDKTLPDLPITYKDFANFENNYYESGKLDKAEQFWISQFNDNIPILNMPTSYPRPLIQSFEGNRINIDINKKQLNQIKVISNSLNITPYILLLSCYYILLAKYTSQNDIVVGSPISGRTISDTSNLIGMFVNTLALRNTIDSNLSFKDFVLMVKNNVLEAYQYQDYPFDKLVDKLEITRDISRNPLFDTMFIYQNNVFNDINFQNNEINMYIPNINISKFDLSLEIIPTNENLHLNFEYSTKLFSKKYIQNLSTHYLNIIDTILQDINIKISSIDILSEKDKNKILSEFNNYSKPYPIYKNIAQIFEEQVTKNPTRVAIKFENQEITYKELNEKANQLANYLISSHVNHDDIIAILLNRSINLIISILGVIKSGASYVLIDNNFPEERIHYILENTNSKICIIDEEKNILFKDINYININKFYFSIYNNNNLNLDYKDNLCIIYTSGSTGKPKGVKLHQKGFINLVYAFNDEMQLYDCKNILSIASVSFDMFEVELFEALLLGKRLILANEEEQKNPEKMAYLISQNAVDFIVTTPSRIELLLSDFKENTFASLKSIQLGGEVFTPNLYTRLKEVTTAKIFNGYGPTEISACCCIKEVTSDDITIGKSLANMKVYICNSNLNLVPNNIVGEICVAGIGVSKGYLNNSTATSKAFLKNPYGEGLLYRTGDLGKYRDDGEIEYINRIDNQVKIRGLRIELGEIEKQIINIPDINSCIVIKKVDESYREFLCAYFTSNNIVSTQEIRKHLSKYLPSYMIPNYFIRLDNFPYTTNGKIDKNKLPDPKYQDDNRNISLPRNLIDYKLINIIKKVLRINNISINDSFFELGGDSLAAINLCINIQKEFNFNISIKDILEKPVIKDISDTIKNNIDTNLSKNISKIDEADYYPTSSAQKRIYYACQIAGNNPTIYNSPEGIIIDGKLNIEKLENCFNILITRHESFRTYFELNNNQLVQKIVPKIDFHFDVIENIEFADLDIQFNNFIKPFDLSKAPLMRVQIIKFTNQKFAILIDIHHIITDGTSINIFINELEKLYNNETLPPLTITYKDFAKYENNLLLSNELKEAKTYWIDQFKDDIPILELPTNYIRPGVQTFDGNRIYSTINKEISNKIKEVSILLGITPYMFLIGAYYILLSKYSSQNDIVIGTPITGRTIADTENVIGMFVNTLALRNKIDSSLSFKDFITSIKNNILDSYKYQEYPFDSLVNNLNIKRDTSRNPLFDTMFIYQNNGYQKLNFKNIKAKYYIPKITISKFDLSLEVIPFHDELKFNFEYSTKLFDESFIKNMTKHYICILQNILNNTNIKIADINMLSNNEKKKIIYDFNNTTIDYPKNKTIITLFEEQVNKSPNDIALTFEGKQLTYNELNQKANSLAYHLRNIEHIKPNDFIGIMTNRSLEMIISILAVLKAGGAYIPIDTSYPKDRINYMLDNSNCKILLTQEKLKNTINFKNILLIDLNKNIYNLPNINLPNINHPEDLAYVIFTSGSTGLPKGVMLKHKALSNLTNYCNHYIEYLKEPSNMAIISITTISFDIFIFESLISLQRGLNVIIANNNEQTTPNLLNKLIEKYNAKAIQSTPSRMQIFLNNIKEIPALTNLKYITLAGEQLPQKLVRDLHHLGDITIYNGYGPSETTIFSSLTKIDNENVTIGKPLDNTQIYILDEMQHPVPLGVTGEIYISGDGVGKGYLNNPELTEKSFIKNPFIPETIMYKTGDLGKYDYLGNIICLGRSDNQIKIRGLRIEIGEIENLILKYPGIKNTVVIKKNLQDREFISAYYTANKRISLSEIRTYLSRFLPKYMIPSYFIVLEDFPYTANGKIDKKKLPLPTGILSVNKEKYISPTTKLQKDLVKVWENILNTKPIGINDNFFELGGDSLLAMNLNMELLKITDQISYTDIFRFPTIIELERKITTNSNTPMFNKIENLSDNFVDILKNSTKKDKIKTWHPKNVLLTGATGFLGIHILENFIKHEKCNIYCIVRNEIGITAKTKLHQKLNYYFGNKYDNLIDKRIFAITGDVTKSGFGLNQDELIQLANSIDVVINSAANVSHFGNYNKFYTTNVTSVQHLINFCKSFNKKIYHISTMSVSGTKLDKSYLSMQKKNIEFNESCLYIGQLIDNVYVRSKFEAEYYMLDAISNGLNGYILRVGNLTPRYRDGIFQENIMDNNFINKSISFINIGAVPNYFLGNSVEFTPVDCATKAIYKLITHPSKKNRIFHINNYHDVLIDRYLNILKKLNYQINVLPENKFRDKINLILNDEHQKSILNNLINDFDKNLYLNYHSDVISSSNFTIKYLKKIHFKWPKISNKYLIRFINLLKKVK